MAEENDIALIESYLQGELDAEQKKQMEQRLETDAEFKVLFDDTSIMLQGLGKLRHKSLLNKIDRLESGLENPLEKKKESKTIFWTIQRVAATFIGLAIIATTSWYLITNGSDPSGGELYGKYFTAYENVMVPVTRSDEDPTLLVRAFRAYEEENYTTAVGLFDELLKLEQNEFVGFYAAIAYMEAGNMGRTTELLKDIITERGEFEKQATWYLALNYIKLEDYDNAKPLLEKLVDNTTYNDRAQQLLKKMR